MIADFKMKKHKEFVYSSKKRQDPIFQIELSKELEDLMEIQRILSSLNEDNIDQSAQEIESYRDVSKLSMSRNLVRYSIIRRNSRLYLDLISKLKNFERLSDIENIIDDYVKQDIPICEAFRNISCKTEESEIRSIIRSDDVASLQSLVDSSLGFDFEQIIYLDHEESFMLRRQCIKCVQLLPYSILCGSVKCFKYLLLNGSKLSKFRYIPAAAIYGQSIEIVRILEQNGFDFNKSLESAIVSHNEEIFEWILTKNPACLDDLNLKITVQHEFIFGLSRFSNINGQQLFDDAMINHFYEIAYLAMKNCMIDPRLAIFDSLKNGTSIAKEFSNLPGFKINFKSYDSFIDKVLFYQHVEYARELFSKYLRFIKITPNSFYNVVKMHDIELIKIVMPVIQSIKLESHLPLLELGLDEEEENLIISSQMKKECVSNIEEGKLFNHHYLKYAMNLSNHNIKKLGNILCAIAEKRDLKMLNVMIDYLNNSPPEFIEQIDLGEKNIINCAILNGTELDLSERNKNQRNNIGLDDFIKRVFQIPKIEENITKGYDSLVLYSFVYDKQLIPTCFDVFEHLDPCRVESHPYYLHLTFPIFEYVLKLDKIVFSRLITKEKLDQTGFFSNGTTEENVFYLIQKFPNCLLINIDGRTIYNVCEALLGDFEKYKLLVHFFDATRPPGQEIFFHDTKRKYNDLSEFFRCRHIEYRLQRIIKFNYISFKYLG